MRWSGNTQQAKLNIMIALITLSLLAGTASAELVHIIASPDARVILTPPNSTTLYIFERNFTFADLRVGNYSVYFNETTDTPIVLRIDGSSSLNVTINTLDENRQYSFTLTSQTTPNPTIFLIRTAVPNQRYEVYKDGNLIDETWTNSSGWIRWKYSGDFSPHTIVFVAKSEAKPPATPTPTPPVVPPPPAPEKSVFDVIVEWLSSIYGFIVLLIILLLLLLKR